MATITAVLGDITKERVDAIVNAANNAMRGGGGVDGAIHRAGGPAVLADCIARFPNGLETGGAGWTTAGDLPARWVIHTVGPNYNAGQRDGALLASCYRSALEVAVELGARSIAFPLISAGVYGWPQRNAIVTAIDTVGRSQTTVEDVRLVAFDESVHRAITDALARATPVRILQGVRILHERGYHRVRILPGMSASGVYWRVAIDVIENSEVELSETDSQTFGHRITYTTGYESEFLGTEVNAASDPDEVANLVLAALPDMVPTPDDPAYVAWFEKLLALVEQEWRLPVAYADHFDEAPGWEVGWGGVRYPHPPDVPAARTCGS